MGRRRRVPRALRDNRELEFDSSLDYLQRGTYGFGTNLRLSDARNIIGVLAECVGRTWEAIDSIADGRGAAARHGWRVYDAQSAEVRELVDRAELPGDTESQEDLRDLIRARLFRFAVHETGRLWGFVADGTFHPLWWDPQHRLNDRATTTGTAQN